MKDDKIRPEKIQSDKIRPMKKEDLDAVMEIERRAFTKPWVRRGFESEITLNSFARYYVIYRKNELLGYGGIWIVLDECHLTTLAVNNKERQKGIGTLLMYTLIARAVREGVVSMSLEVRPSNTAARRLYAKFGFSIERVRKNYYIDEDAVVMSNNQLEKTFNKIEYERNAERPYGQIIQPEEEEEI